MEATEKLLNAAVEENERLNAEIQELREKLDRQTVMMRKLVNSRMSSRADERAEEARDTELFTMMRERPELSEGALRLVITGESEQYADAPEAVVNDVPGSLPDEANEPIQTILFLAGMILLATGIVALKLILG